MWAVIWYTVNMKDYIFITITPTHMSSNERFHFFSNNKSKQEDNPFPHIFSHISIRKEGFVEMRNCPFH